MKNIAAALVFFTRLPFWRLKAFNIPAEYFKQVINYWPIVGWLTAAVMAGTLYTFSQVVPYSIAIILAFVSRLLVTGALHEDGLADFFDGIGGGTTRERILEIMKDSHIGTYGVISLIFYFLLMFMVFSNMQMQTACLVILAGDPLCKFIASQITLFLPYARTQETSKSKTVYEKMALKPFLISFLFGVLPLVLLLDIKLWIAVLLPILVFFLVIYILKRKIGGYTGDCCGAMFLLCELSFYIGIIMCYTVFIR